MVKAKEIAGLDCLGFAARGVTLVLRSRLEEMCEFRVAALDYSDIEGVHDMRVASRRLRSAMRDCKPYLRAKKMRRARAYLKAVADALGAVRDEDVAILALEELKAEAPEEVIAGIDHLIAERAAAREEARAALAEAISEGTLARLQGEFIYSLERATKPKEPDEKEFDEAETVGADAETVVTAEPADAVPSFYQAGREIIAARLEELQSLSASLYQPFDTEPLHRMRIAAKRLRYAIELFAQCWGETLLPFAKDVASMQSHLGQVHDCDEWIDTLGERLGAEPVEGDETDVEVEKEKRRAVFWLLGHFTKARTKHYCSALERFAKWEENACPANLIAILEREPEPAVEQKPVEQPQPVEQRPAPPPEAEAEAIDASVPTQV